MFDINAKEKKKAGILEERKEEMNCMITALSMVRDRTYKNIPEYIYRKDSLDKEETGMG